MRIGIDLLWVRPGICGGTESFIRNLLDGLTEYDLQNEYILFVSRDNADSFAGYAKKMSLHICPVNCASQPKRILWENLHLDKAARRAGVDIMFIPVYSKPRSGKRLPYVSVIHDLQALHYPEYFSFMRKCFLKYSWKYTCKSSARVITISDYCKEDLLQKYPFVKENVTTVYNPVVSGKVETDFAALKKRYGLDKGTYFYCVTSLLPHKNVDTILKVMQSWQGKEKLVISGVGQKQEELGRMLKKYGVTDKVIMTGYVSAGERDCLYENCRLFLFPSVFEGFGMPPIEAMRRGKRVVMTRKSCLEEVTEGRAVYVDKPFEVAEWLQKIEYAMELPEKKEEFEKYRLEKIVEEYVRVFGEVG